jgi:hypothetical protein
LDAVLKGFYDRKRNGLFYLVAVFGEHDYLGTREEASSVVFSVVASILSLEEELTWKFSRQKMMSGEHATG